VLGLGSGLDLAFRLCSLCNERHWCYAYGWPERQFIIICTHPSIAGDGYQLGPPCRFDAALRHNITQWHSTTQLFSWQLPV